LLVSFGSAALNGDDGQSARTTLLRRADEAKNTNNAAVLRYGALATECRHESLSNLRVPHKDRKLLLRMINGD